MGDAVTTVLTVSEKCFQYDTGSWSVRDGTADQQEKKALFKKCAEKIGYTYGKIWYRTLYQHIEKNQLQMESRTKYRKQNYKALIKYYMRISSSL